LPQPGQPVLTIADDSRLRVDFYVEQRDVPYVHVGDLADVADGANSDRNVQARVACTSNELDQRLEGSANDIDGAQGRENGFAEPFDDGEIGDSDGLRIAGTFRLTHSGPVEHLPHDKGAVDPAVAAGDASAAGGKPCCHRLQSADFRPSSNFGATLRRATPRATRRDR
jgi:HlyD family secretion protein